jgi:hypothetical protein
MGTKFSEQPELTAAPADAFVPIVSGGVNYRITKANLLAAGYDISSFAAVTPTVEVGATVTNPAFTAAHNHTPSASLTLTNNKTGEAKNVLGTPTSFSSSAGGQVLNTVGGVWTFTLTGVDVTGSDARTASITARQKNFAGKPTVGNTSPATLAAGATYAVLDADGAFSFPITDDGTHEIQFMRRTAYGAPSFVKDSATGFGVSYTLVGTSSYTNAQGFAENFNLYKLDVAINGTKTIDVGA